MRKSTLTLSEAAVVSLICFGLFILWSMQSVLAGFPEARFSNSSNGEMVGLEIVLAAAALLYLHARGFDTSSLYPRPSIRGSLIGLGLFASAWLAGEMATSPFYTPEQPQVVLAAQP